jgi:hypothetical protein
MNTEMSDDNSYLLRQMINLYLSSRTPHVIIYYTPPASNVNTKHWDVGINSC